MTVQIGVNGFGRIGRLVFRAAIVNPKTTIVAVNDPFLTVDYAAYQLKYDSVHGKFDATIEVDGDCLIVNGQRVKFFAEMNPAEIGWGEVGADYVCFHRHLHHHREGQRPHPGRCQEGHRLCPLC